MIAALTVALAAATAATPGPAADGQARRLIDAIRRVESHGNDRAVGDGGRSLGPYQCGRAAWIDGGGKAGDYRRLVWDRAAVEGVMLRYWQRLGCTTDEQRARCWNGGPAGMRKAATVDYWRRVRAALANKGKAKP